MQKAITYRRISTSTKSSKQDINRQLQPIQLYCENHKLQIIDNFTDSLSGTVPTHKRAGYRDMLKYIEEYEGDKKDLCIVFDEVSRLGRTKNIIFEACDFFTNQGINVHFVSPECNLLNSDGTINEMADTIITIFAQLAQNERNRIVHRVRTSIPLSAKQGKALGSTYGYTSKNKKIIIEEENEAPIVRKIFQMYCEGIGGMAISKYLNNENIKTKGGHDWTPQRILAMLKNKQYIGIREIKGELYTMPSIIDKATFERAHNIRINKKQHITRERKHINPLVGKIQCGCGKRLYINNSMGLKYTCKSVQMKSCNSFNSVNYKLLNNSLYTLFEQIVGESSQNQQSIIKLEKEIEQLNNISIPNIQHQIFDIDNRKKRIDKMFEYGRISESKYIERLNDADNDEVKYNTQLDNYEARLRDIERQIKALKADNDIGAIIDLNSFKHFIQTHIDNIVINTIEKPEALKNIFKLGNDVVYKINVTSVTGTELTYYIANRTNNIVAYELDINLNDGSFKVNNDELNALKGLFGQSQFKTLQFKEMIKKFE